METQCLPKEKDLDEKAQVYKERCPQTTQEHSVPPQPDTLARLFSSSCTNHVKTEESATETANTPSSQATQSLTLPQEPLAKETPTNSLKTSEKVANTVAEIPINQIIPNPNQPRKAFSESAILKLADSINQFGIIQPLTVRKSGHLYELIAGERRLRAAKELCWSSVPCIISEVTEEKSAQISIVENLLREDLNIFEQAIAIQSLIDTYCLTQEQIAEKLSASQSYVANKLRLLRFSQEERDKILQNNLSERHARSLLRINDANLRNKVIESIINNELNVSATEELIQSVLQGKDSAQKPQKDHKAYKDIPSFFDAVNRAIDCAKMGNLNIKCRKIVGESFTELTIIIPNIHTDNGK